MCIYNRFKYIDNDVLDDKSREYTSLTITGFHFNYVSSAHLSWLVSVNYTR